MSDFSVKTEEFEGPLHLLLDLIEKRKFLINDLSLSQITDDFVTHLNGLGKISATKISDFLVVASTLILIKSKSLLPTLALEEDEEQSIEELELRLKLLKIMRGLSEGVQSIFQKKILFKKKQVRVRAVKFSPTDSVNSHNLRITMLGVINTFPKFEEKREARVRKVISLEEMMNRVINRVKRNVRMSFSKLSKEGESKEKVDVIIGFLAVLELVKNGFISAKQEDRYDDINLESKEVGTPSFGS
jgi:segregation and condensation protein A